MTWQEWGTPQHDQFDPAPIIETLGVKDDLGKAAVRFLTERRSELVPYLHDLTFEQRTAVFANGGEGKTMGCVPLAASLTGKRTLVIEPTIASTAMAQKSLKDIYKDTGVQVGYAYREAGFLRPCDQIDFVTPGVAKGMLLSGQLVPEEWFLIVDEYHQQADPALLGMLDSIHPNYAILSATMDIGQVERELGFTGVEVGNVRGRAEDIDWHREKARLDEFLGVRGDGFGGYIENEILCQGKRGVVFVDSRRLINSTASRIRAKYPELPVAAYMSGSSLRHFEQQMAAVEEDAPMIVLATMGAAGSAVNFPALDQVVIYGDRVSNRESTDGLMVQVQKGPPNSNDTIQMANRAARYAGGVPEVWMVAPPNSREEWPTVRQLRQLQPTGVSFHPQKADYETAVLIGARLRGQGVSPRMPRPLFGFESKELIEATNKLYGGVEKAPEDRILDERGYLTAKGEQITELPLSVEQARLVLETPESYRQALGDWEVVMASLAVVSQVSLGEIFNCGANEQLVYKTRQIMGKMGVFEADLTSDLFTLQELLRGWVNLSDRQKIELKNGFRYARFDVLDTLSSQIKSTLRRLGATKEEAERRLHNLPVLDERARENIMRYMDWAEFGEEVVLSYDRNTGNWNVVEPPPEYFGDEVIQVKVDPTSAICNVEGLPFVERLKARATIGHIDADRQSPDQAVATLSGFIFPEKPLRVKISQMLNGN